MLLRTKVSAIVLGPAGVGLVGLANNVVVMFSGLAAFGISDSGARQIAASRDEVGARLARRAIVLLSVTLALLGASLVLLFSGLLSAKLFEEPTHATLVVWLSVAVLFSILAGGQRAIIAGERRVDDLARLSIISGVISTAVGVMVLWLFGTGGIIAYVVSAPIVLFATGSYRIWARGAEQVSASIRTTRIAEPVKAMLRLGGHGRVWVICETLNAACFVGLSWFLMGLIGLTGVGVAYALAMAIYMPLILALAFRFVRFRPSRALLRLVLWQAAALAAVLVLTRFSVLASEIAGASLAVIFGLIAIRKLGSSLPGPFGTVYSRLVGAARG